MNLGQFLGDLWALATAALTLNVPTLKSVLAQPDAVWLVAALVLLAGISRLLGDSVVLFVNRVSPRRFVLSLIGGGLLFVLELAVWAASIWLIADWLFGATQTPGAAFLVVAAASAPWLFGFLVFAPYLGELVRWVLRIWSWLIVLALLRDAFALSLVAAFITATAGWLVLRGIERLLARRAPALENWFWSRLTGTPVELTFAQQADELAQQLRETSI